VTFETKICEQIPHLRRYARALCDDPVNADDLVQDCLERALNKRHLWRPRSRMRPWLFRMMYRQYLNRVGSARARREVTFQDPAADLCAGGDQSTLANSYDVLTAVGTLPPEQRAVLMLMVLEAPDYREAASLLGIRVGTVRSRLSRARESVRQHCERPASAVDHGLRRVK